MTLRFKDEKGQRGKVTESLDVEYSGAWQQDVRDVVAEVEEDPPDDDFYDPEEPLSYLVIELPEVAPITEVSRDASQSISTQE